MWDSYPDTLNLNPWTRTLTTLEPKISVDKMASISEVYTDQSLDRPCLAIRNRVLHQGWYIKVAQTCKMPDLPATKTYYKSPVRLAAGCWVAKTLLEFYGNVKHVLKSLLAHSHWDSDDRRKSIGGCSCTFLHTLTLCQSVAFASYFCQNVTFYAYFQIQFMLIWGTFLLMV